MVEIADTSSASLITRSCAAFSPRHSYNRTRFTQFFANCTGCHFDFLCFHIYDCNVPWFDAGAVNYWLGQVKGFGLPIWLTEFDCPANSGSVTVADELAWMQRVLPSLDSDAQIERFVPHHGGRLRRS